MNTDDYDLPSKLHELADEEQFAVPDLVGSAVARRRRRQATMGGIAAVSALALVGGGFAASDLLRTDVVAQPAGSASMTPAVVQSEPDPSPTPTAPESTPQERNAVETISPEDLGPLDAAVVAERCTAQLNRGAADATAWVLAAPQQHLVGDLVILDNPTTGRSALCSVPTAALAAEAPAGGVLNADPETPLTVLNSCARALYADTVLFREGEEVPDLLKGTMFAYAQQGNALEAAIDIDGELYRCGFAPGQPVGLTRYHADPSLPRTDLDGSVGYLVSVASADMTVPKDATFLFAGTLPDDAARVEFAGGIEATVELQERGTLLAFLDGDWSAEVTYRVLDADGGVLHSGVAHRPNGDGQTS